MTFRSASSRRVVIGLALAILPAGLLIPIGCSSPESHPPLIGDCSGPLCPPVQNQGIKGAGSGGGTDGGTGAETGSDSGSGGDSGIGDSGLLGD